ncbi:MAG: hypothetical protein VYE77_09880 [Planctomycetota bacterium]|nr:hypothetical protein [Planctomycetota bacterium]
MSSRRLHALAASILLAVAATAQARLKPGEAMALCFPDHAVSVHPVLLDQKQRTLIAKASGEKAPRKIIHTYKAHKGKDLVAIGYVDAHLVRTKKQILLVIIDTAGKNAGKVRRVEVLAFTEPAQYRPAGRFYAQFQGLNLSRDLREGRQIKRVTGATMTTRATTAAVRRTLATHGLLHKLPE